MNEQGLLPHTPETVTIGGRTYQLQEEMQNYQRSLDRDQEPNYKEPEYEEIKPQRPDFRTQSNRTWSYYQKMKKDNKWAYIPHDVEKQMLADYKTLGERFEDGDFNQ